MSYRKDVTIICEDCQDYLMMGGYESVVKTRKEIAKLGWRCIREDDKSLDLCPVCVKKRKEQGKQRGCE